MSHHVSFDMIRLGCVPTLPAQVFHRDGGIMDQLDQNLFPFILTLRVHVETLFVCFSAEVSDHISFDISLAGCVATMPLISTAAKKMEGEKSQIMVQQLFKTPVYTCVCVTCVCATCVCVMCVCVCHGAATLQDTCIHVCVFHVCKCHVCVCVMCVCVCHSAATLQDTCIHVCVRQVCVCVMCVCVCHDAATLQDICMLHKLTHMRCTCAQTDTHLYKVIGKKPPWGGVSLLCGFQIKNSREEDPLKNHPKINQF